MERKINKRQSYRKKDPGKKMDLSIVIPVYNEYDSIDPLYKRLDGTLSKLDLDYEVILIDDGSKDDTYKKLLEIPQKNAFYKIIRFRKNFGQTSAMIAGFKHARGDIIITLDADLQNDPQDIPKLLKEIAKGFDIVSGWRKERKENAFTRRIPSMLANKIISKLSGVYLHDYGCTLKAYRKEIVDNIDLSGEMHRYIPAVASSMGVSVSEIVVKHHSRKFGSSKYGLTRTVRVILDIITMKFLLSYSQRPFQIFGMAGIFTSLIGFIMTAYLIIMRVFFGQGLTNRPLFLLSIFIIFIGIQFVTMGLLAELIMRTYHEAQNKPIYVIRDIVDKSIKHE